MNPGTGYGIDGIALAEELFDINADIHLEPLYVGVPLPAKVAALFTKPRPEAFEVAINHVSPDQLTCPPGLQLAAKRTVAWSMWEFTSFGEEKFVKDIEERLSTFDLILVYDEVSKMAFEPYADPERIQILQGGYSPDFWLPSKEDPERDWTGTFRFGMVGALSQRKNPFAAIRAFNALKEEHGAAFDAELHLKTVTRNLHPAMEQVYPGLKIHYDSWTPSQLKKFYLSLHSLVAPSWGEGKNLPALEAQTTGCPVIASKFGGHMQWADSSWTYLVGGPLEEHAPSQKSMRVNEEELKAAMWRAYTDRSEARQMGELASRMIPAQCDWSRVVERLRYMLDAVTPKPRPS
jgi:glycosyltransferase involved in cell wall biosynthesis